MKRQSLLVFFTLLYSVSVFANGGFEPTSKACVNVGKEINRVNDDMQVAKSGIQKSWLNRQLKALKIKRGSCSLKGFHDKPIVPFSSANDILVNKDGHIF